MLQNKWKSPQILESPTKFENAPNALENSLKSRKKNQSFFKLWTKELLSGPNWPWLQDCGYRHSTVPLHLEKHQIHKIRLFNKSVPLCQFSHRRESVLYDTHDWLVGLGRHNQSGHQCQLQNRGARFHRLLHMQIHFVAVEIGIVRRGDGQIEAKRGPRQHLHQMAHHTHFVQRRLPIENDDVIVPDVPFDLVPNLEMQIRRLWVVPQVYTVPCV